ncbi:hypothetical protein FRC08_016241 [Ceratobasidium sp. 394]|nr:hypothetical protein FRC08_016241 [Ceratobasidium sp. 394]
MTYLFARASRAVSLVPPAYYADLACERGRCYIAPLLSPHNKTNLIRNGLGTEEEVVKEANRLWGRGPTGPEVQRTMFYL